MGARSGEGYATGAALVTRRLPKLEMLQAFHGETRILKECGGGEFSLRRPATMINIHLF
jgi:hypothetical protein